MKPGTPESLKSKCEEMRDFLPIDPVKISSYNSVAHCFEPSLAYLLNLNTTASFINSFHCFFISVFLMQVEIGTFSVPFLHLSYKT